MTTLARKLNAILPLSQSDRKVLLDAATALQDEVACLFGAHSCDGVWVLEDDADKEAMRLYGRFVRLAGRLRAIAGCGRKRKGAKG